MSWRTAAAVLIAVISILLVQAVLVAPMHKIQTQLNQSGDYSDLDGVSGYNGNDVISPTSGPLASWLNMGLIAVFGLMLWGVYRVGLSELRSRRGGGGL